MLLELLLLPALNVTIGLPVMRILDAAGAAAAAVHVAVVCTVCASTPGCEMNAALTATVRASTTALGQASAEIVV
jgi:hypothetical protein